MTHSTLLAAALALAGACSALPAHAALGGNIATSAVSAGALRARAMASSAPGAAAAPAPTSFTRAETPLEGGGKVVEFADASGSIFAVSWEAPAMPDLAALLGDYKARWQQAQRGALAAGSRSPRHLGADDGDWVIVSTGHLRAYRGYSYLKSAAPAGFDLAELTK